MIGMEKSQSIRYRAEIAIFELVLSVNVRRNAAADGYARRTRHDRKNPTPRHSEPIKIAQRNTRLDGHVTGRRIKLQNAVEASGIDRDDSLSGTCRAICQTCATWNYQRRRRKFCKESAVAVRSNAFGVEAFGSVEAG